MSPTPKLWLTTEKQEEKKFYDFVCEDVVNTLIFRVYVPYSA